MTLKDIPAVCHCGKPMHLSASQQWLIRKFGRSWGTTKKIVLLQGKSYTVPTYYLILHTISYESLPGLGFPEAKT